MSKKAVLFGALAIVLWSVGVEMGKRHEPAPVPPPAPVALLLRERVDTLDAALDMAVGGWQECRARGQQ